MSEPREPGDPDDPSQSRPQPRAPRPPGEPGMSPADLIEALLELTSRAGIEVRILPRSGGRASEDELRPRESAACRVGERVWVMLAPEDPPLRQAEVLAATLVRHRAAFLQESFLLPAVRAFVDRVEI